MTYTTEAQMKMEDIKKVQLSILDFIRNVCKKHNLTYYLCGGTLIGAVRHKGYIPWDDDIDIALLRDDYEKFIKIVSNNSSVYKIYTLYNDTSYPYRCVKLYDSRTFLVEEVFEDLLLDIGVNVDIFPIDEVPQNKNRQKFLYFKIYFIDYLYQLKCAKIQKQRKFYKNLIIIIVKILLFFISYNQLSRLIDHIANKKYDSNFCGRVAMGYGLRQVVPKEVYSSVEKMWFENRECTIPKGYHQLLTQVYGDYMKLPPIELRTGHKVRAFRKIYNIKEN